MHDELRQAHDTSKAQFGKLAEARGMLDRARVELESLGKLGDMITQEDVIKGAGKLVAAGLSPMALAKLLSDMPEKSEPLAAWVQGHAQQLAAREAQLDPVLAQARHGLGVTAMRSLLVHQLVPQGQGPGQMPAGAGVSPAAGANPLSPGPSPSLAQTPGLAPSLADASAPGVPNV